MPFSNGTNGWRLRILTTALLGALIASSGWLIGQVIDLKGWRQGIDEQMVSRTSDRYRAADAARDFALRDEQIKELTRRLERMGK